MKHIGLDLGDSQGDWGAKITIDTKFPEKIITTAKMLEFNSIKQVRVCLEEVGDIVTQFQEDVIDLFNFSNNKECEIQHRGIGINFAFQEEIHRSDDEILYFLKEDKLVAMLIIRRTTFNNAEITMITTENRTYS